VGVVVLGGQDGGARLVARITEETKGFYKKSRTQSSEKPGGERHS
jgi:hypothetical protein